MKLLTAILLFLVCSTAAMGQAFTTFPTVNPNTGTDQFYCVKTLGTDNKCVLSNIYNYIFSTLPNVVGDSGSGGTKGLVPAPGAGDAALGKYLDAFGLWSNPAPCVRIESYGGSSNGSTDNAAAWTAMMATNPGCVTFAAGTYLLSARTTYTLPNSLQTFKVYCSGSEATKLYWPNTAGGLLLTKSSLTQSITVDGCAITTGQPSGGSGIEITTNLATVTVPLWNPDYLNNITFRGSDGLAVTNYWTKNLYTLNVGTVTCNDCTAWGSVTGAVNGYAGNGQGWDIEGDANHLVTVFNASHFQGYYLSSCFVYGNNVQGVTINNGWNCTAGTKTVSMNGGSGQIQLVVSDGSSNVSGTSFDISTALVGVDIHDNQIFIPNGTAIGADFEPASFITVHHNTVSAISIVQGTGFKVGSTTAGTNSIDNNILQSLTNGSTIANGATNLTLNNNKYYGNTKNINNLNASYVRSLILDYPQDCSSTMQLLFAGSVSGVTLTTPYCQYSNDGNNLSVDMLLVLTALSGTSTDAATVSLPMQAGVSQGEGVCAFRDNSGMLGLTVPVPHVVPGNAVATLAQQAATGTVPMTRANFTNASSLKLFCQIPLFP